MKTQREVFNKLFKEDKTELSAEKIELGIMQDVQKSMNTHKQKRKSFDDSSDRWYIDLFKVRDKFSKVEVDYKDFKSSLSDLEKFIKELENMAKELGVQPSSLDGYNEAKGLINTSDDMDDVYKEAKKMESKIG
jgi:predicted  nucleic acid-binding Zn-ribbon protein